MTDFFFLEKLSFLANRENMEIMSRKIQKYNFVNFSALFYTDFPYFQDERLSF